jgi:hypothetical protein
MFKRSPAAVVGRGELDLRLRAHPPAAGVRCERRDTSISVNQSPFASSRQLAAGSIPKAGEILVIEPTTGDVAPQEVRTVTSVTGTGPFTINFSGGGLVRSHATGTRCELGIKDYDARNIVNPLIDACAQEFDGTC